MFVILIANQAFREPIFTLNDADLARLSTVNELA